MFERLGEAIEELSIPADGTALAAAVALRDRLEAKIAEATGAFEAVRGWDVEGATSMTAWLRDRAGMTRKGAARLRSTARLLRRLPATSAAWRAGDLTSGQVDAMAAVLDARTVGLFAEHEEALLPSLAGLSVPDTARAMGHWKAHAVAEGGDEAAPDEPERAVHLAPTLGGRWVLDGDLDAESGATVDTALRLAEAADAEAEPVRPASRRRADALVDVCRFFLEHRAHPPGNRHRPHLNVVVDLDDLQAARGGRVVDGPALSGVALQALLCDSALHRFVVAGRSVVLDYGTATRTIPAPLWNALVLRDERCRFPGCDRPSSWCEGHHVVPVVEGGPTNLDNLVLVCSRHHHRLHQPGWHAKLRPDATLEVTDPAGRHRVTAPPRAGPAG